jgi:CRP-like cAMP-binding protein
MIKLSPEDREFLKSAFELAEEKRFVANEIIVEHDTICSDIFYIKSGFTRNYYLSDKGTDVTIWFSGKETITTLGKSFYRQEKSLYGLQALDETTLYTINYEQFESLRNNCIFSSELLEKFLWETCLYLSDRTIDFQTLTAKERYNKMLLTYPDIFRKAQLSHIATYLGITQQSLSRIRAQK